MMKDLRGLKILSSGTFSGITPASIKTKIGTKAMKIKKLKGSGGNEAAKSMPAKRTNHQGLFLASQNNDNFALDDAIFQLLLHFLYRSAVIGFVQFAEFTPDNNLSIWAKVCFKLLQQFDYAVRRFVENHRSLLLV